MMPPDVEIPPNVARLSRNSAGYPVPWFVAEVDGVPDFRVMDVHKLVRAVKERRCWLCGEPYGHGATTFVTGPMCGINRISAEPPCHYRCAVFSAQTCPFLINPAKGRREANMPEGHEPSAGIMLRRNPGVALLWTSRTWRAWRPDPTGGVLFRLGEPVACSWYREGRPATYLECVESIESGLPALLEVSPGPAERLEIERRLEALLVHLPAKLKETY